MNIARKALVPAAGGIALAATLGFGAAFALQDSEPDAASPATQANQQDAEGAVQDELSPVERRQERMNDFLDRVAEELGVERSALDDAIVAARLAQLDEAVAEGIIDEERAEKIHERIESGDVPGLFGRGFHHHHHPGKFRGGPGPFDERPADGGAEESGAAEDSEASIGL